MNGNAVMKYLLSFGTSEFQSYFGSVRFGLTIVSFVVLVNVDTGSGRLGFACGSEANDELKRRCFSKYSADMSSFFFANTFVWMTVGALTVLWVLILVYSSKHLQKIRRKTDDIERKQLCHELWEKSRLHVCSELALVIFALIFFFCTQEITLPETYNCTLWNASKEIVLPCEDVHHWGKSKLNYTFILVMGVLVLLCIATIFETLRNKEYFIKDLLDLNTKENEADGNHRNKQRNGNDGSGRLTDTSNYNEQPVAPVKHKVWNIDAAQVPDDVCQDLADDISLDWKKLGRRLGISKAHLKNIAHENHYVCEQSIALLNEWRERAGEEATVGVLRKALKEIGKKGLSEKVRDKMLAKQPLLLTEGGLAAWNTETGYADSSWQSTFDTSPNLTGTAPSESTSASSSVSRSLSSSIRHRKGGGDSVNPATE